MEIARKKRSGESARDYLYLPQNSLHLHETLKVDLFPLETSRYFLFKGSVNFCTLVQAEIQPPLPPSDERKRAFPQII